MRASRIPAERGGVLRKAFLKFERLLEPIMRWPRVACASFLPRRRCGSTTSSSCDACSTRRARTPRRRAPPHPLSAAPPVARRQRVLSLALRRDRDPHGRRRRRMGDDDDRAWTGADIEIVSELSFLAFDSVCLLGLHLSPRASQSTRRVQADGATAPYGDPTSARVQRSFDALTTRARGHPNGRIDRPEHLAGTSVRAAWSAHGSTTGCERLRDTATSARIGHLSALHGPRVGHLQEGDRRDPGGVWRARPAS